MNVYIGDKGRRMGSHQQGEVDEEVKPVGKGTRVRVTIETTVFIVEHNDSTYTHNKDGSLRDPDGSGYTTLGFNPVTVAQFEPKDGDRETYFTLEVPDVANDDTIIEFEVLS